MHQVKEELKIKVQPIELGIGISIENKNTRTGGLVLQCGSDESVAEVQSVIQKSMRDQYEVREPRLRNSRL